MRIGNVLPDARTALEHRKAILPRQIPIEHDDRKIRPAILERRQGGRPIPHPIDRKGLIAKALDQALPIIRSSSDQKQAHGTESARESGRLRVGKR